MREGGFGGDMPEGMTHEGLDQYMGGFGIRHTNRQKIADMLAERWNLSPAEAEEMAEEAVNNETADDGLDAFLDDIPETGGGMDDPLGAGPPTTTNVENLLGGEESGNPLLDRVAQRTEAEKIAAARAKKRGEERVQTSADPLSLAWNHLSLLKRRV